MPARARWLGLGLVVGVLVALRQHAGGGDRVGLGHAPRLQDRQADLLAVGLRQRLRHGGAAAADVAELVRLAGQVRQHALPDGRDAGGEGDALVDDQLGQRLGLHHRARA